jgi:cytochrome c oxidase cbb3-type subunit 3
VAAWLSAALLSGVLVSCVLLLGQAHAQAPVPGPVEAGGALYARYCQLCHAADGTGYAADEAPSLVSPNFLATANDAFIARGIRLGRPNTAMAAYGKARGGPLDDAQIASIVRFLRSKGRGAVHLPEVKVTGNAARGAEVYSRHCRSCHGTSQQPGKAPQLSNPEFLAAASPAFLRHAIRHGRPPTRMPAFAKRLSGAQIDDVLAWLTSLPAGSSTARPENASVPRDLPLVIHPNGQAPKLELRAGRFVAAAQLEQALKSGRRVIIIDARAPSDWLAFHIPGAVPIPYYDTAELDRLPNDGTWVIAYCACPHHASGEVVDALRRRGFPNTAVLDEGILHWRKAGYPLVGHAIEPAKP